MAIASEALILDGRYEVGPVLGRGGMGEVRKAHDRRLSRDVAVKFLRADLAAQPDIRERFGAEARNAARLTNPNVVLVLDTGEHDGIPYLVMECLPGPTLHDELQNGPVSEECAKRIGRDVLSGLIAAHELGIIHRDISPANILLAEDGHVKIADFGIAKSAEGMSLTMVGTVLGTPAYLAPERLRGEPATPATDVYALGVVLYEVLTGARPFAGKTPVEVASSVMATTPEPLSLLRPDLDPNLTAAVDGAMQKDPARRIPTATAMLEVLNGAERTRAIPIVPTVALDEPPSTIAFAPISAPVARWWSRVGDSPRDVAIALVALAAIGLLLLGIAMHKSGDPANDVSANQTPTTQAPPPTTAVTAPPVTAASVARVSVTPAPKHGGEKPKPGKHGGHG